MPDKKMIMMIIISVIYAIFIGLSYSLNSVSKKLVKSNVHDDELDIKNMSTRGLMDVKVIPPSKKRLTPLDVKPEDLDEVIRNKGL